MRRARGVPWAPVARARKAMVVLAALGLWLALHGEAWACSSCYGAADGPMIDAARLGIWLLLGVTVCVQGGFAAFFIHLRRRASRMADQALDEEWSRLQREWDHGGRIR